MEDWMKELLQKNNENKVTASKPSPQKKAKSNIYLHLDNPADRREGNKAASGYYRDRNCDRCAGSQAPKAMASAPYNFVSLPHRILPAPFALDEVDVENVENMENITEDYKKYVSSEGKNTGCIRLEIQALTPLFIGSGTGSEETDAFFSPTGRPVIPGSSIRGMTRNLLKIITAGAMRGDEDFADRHLYYRQFMAKRKGFGSEAKAGFLIRSKGHYYVCPAQYESSESSGNGPAIRWNEDKADIITGKMTVKMTGKMKRKSYQYTIQFSKGILDKDNRIPVQDYIIKDYKSDSNRFSGNGSYKGWGLFSEKAAKAGEDARSFTNREDIDFIVPCFFQEQNGEVLSFGHCKNYRTPYTSSIGDHVPAGLKKNIPDFADAIFGRKELWAGRVSFEDGEMTVKGTPLPANYPRPLMEPKPTSYQLYLRPSGRQPKNWNEKTDIRGYKLYWHRKEEKGKPDWVLSDGGARIKGVKKISPLGPGTHFNAKIHFKHLSDVELGALLTVFGLDDGTHDVVYKLGRGKSIGMGSVRIKASLYLENSRERYSSLFNGDSWKEAEKENDGLVFKNAFHQYLVDHLKDEKPAYNAYKKLMEELLTMLDWRHNVTLPNWREKTDMMPVGDSRFKHRVVLDNPYYFVKKDFRK